MEEKRWQVNPSLDFPDLRPPAVQFAIFERDPVPAFRKQVSAGRGFAVKQLAEAEGPFRRGIARQCQMIASWDIGFRDTPGSEVYLLASGSGIATSLPDCIEDRSENIFCLPCVATTMISNGPAGKKWFVTKAVILSSKVICWSIPFDADPNRPVEITLTEKNALDLSPIYDEVMS